MARIKAKKTQAEVKLNKEQTEKVRVMLWSIAQRAADGDDVSQETSKLTRKSFEMYTEILTSIRGDSPNSVKAMPSQASSKREGLTPKSSKLSLASVRENIKVVKREPEFFENIEVIKDVYEVGTKLEQRAIYEAVSLLKDNAHQGLKAIDELKATGHKVQFKTEIEPLLNDLAEANALCAICWLLREAMPSTTTFNYVAGRFKGETFSAKDCKETWLANLRNLCEHPLA